MSVGIGQLLSVDLQDSVLESARKNSSCDGDSDALSAFRDFLRSSVYEMHVPEFEWHFWGRAHWQCSMCSLWKMLHLKYIFILIVECCCCFLLIIKPDIRKIFSAGLLQKFCDVCFCFACMPSNAWNLIPAAGKRWILSNRDEMCRFLHFLHFIIIFWNGCCIYEIKAVPLQTSCSKNSSVILTTYWLLVLVLLIMWLVWGVPARAAMSHFFIWHFCCSLDRKLYR